MAEATTPALLTALIPMAHVADVQQSVNFYKLLGMELLGSLKASEGALRWAHVTGGNAHLMFARATAPVVSREQAVLFYLYTRNLIALRDHLLAAGVSVSSITHPDYMPKGEIRVEDPDGYVLLIGQAG